MSSVRSSHRVTDYPNARLALKPGLQPVEVTLIAQLGIGAGSRLVAQAEDRQRHHEAFVDDLQESSTQIGIAYPDADNPSSLYTFSVGPQGHPYHRHAGQRVFTAISGSTGARLAFSAATDDAIARDPHAFVDGLRFVTVPPDTLFTVRFGPGTWHRFVPMRPCHPALFAISCHPDDFANVSNDGAREQLARGEASIPFLTELLPTAAQRLADDADPETIPTTRLSLRVPATSTAAVVCAFCRRVSGWFGRLVRLPFDVPGYITNLPGRRTVVEHAGPEADSLLANEVLDHDHEDAFSARIRADEAGPVGSVALLARVLEGFLQNRPTGVSLLMRIRNVLVRPLRLRRSPLGCPVSSLLSEQPPARFLNRFPTLAHRVCEEEQRAEVLLGANDRHLHFRSLVAVTRLANGDYRVTLADRVRTHNAFGRLYMALIGRTHRRYIAPAMLRAAIDYAVFVELPARVPASR